MSEDKIFVCDADGVLLDTETAFRAHWSKLLGLPISEGVFIHWDHALALGVTNGAKTKFWETFWHETSLEPYALASWFIKKLQSHGYKVYILTSRAKSLKARQSLLRDIQKLSTDVDDIIFCDHTRENKSDYINKLPNAKYFIDDHVKNAADAQVHCRHLSRVLLYNRSWNQSADISGYLRVFSYDDALRKLPEFQS